MLREDEGPPFFLHLRYYKTMDFRDYIEILNLEFEKRKLANSAYSLRAFARDLDLSAPRLSQILNKKSGLSFEAAEALAEKLRLDEQQKKWFCDSAAVFSERSSSKKEEFANRIKEYKRESKKFSEINLEYFKVIEDWFHFGILELTYLKDFQNSEAWMAKKLGITKTEVMVAVERMKKLGLITEKDGRLIDTFKFLATPSDVPSISLRKFNAQLMKLAIEALHQQDVNTREISSNIFALNQEQIPEFKDKIREFRRDLERFASDQKDKDAVYCLGMQFYSLSL
jgi:uncharacterized protein (TIGR02147 family)